MQLRSGCAGQSRGRSGRRAAVLGWLLWITIFALAYLNISFS
jgi:hypothetical protein